MQPRNNLRYVIMIVGIVVAFIVIMLALYAMGVLVNA
jgi:hypothetical protein